MLFTSRRTMLIRRRATKLLTTEWVNQGGAAGQHDVGIKPLVREGRHHWKQTTQGQRKRYDRGDHGNHGNHTTMATVAMEGDDTGKNGKERRNRRRKQEGEIY